MNKNKFCYRCKISMQKQIVVNKDKIQTLRFICPACQMYEEEECDISGSKYSAWSELDVLRES